MHPRSGPLLVVSIDGVRADAVGTGCTPVLDGLAADGAWTLAATTVVPPVTLPAHQSMTRSLDPADHGILDNEPAPLREHAPSFLDVARAAGLRTAFVHNWAPLASVVDPGGAWAHWFVDTGDEPTGDRAVRDTALACLAVARPDLLFVYLSDVDNAGHDHGWGSAAYQDALRRADDHLGHLVDALVPGAAVLVTTDHGGVGHEHDRAEPATTTTFLVVRGPAVRRGGLAGPVSVLDVAPCVAALLGIAPHPRWRGRLPDGLLVTAPPPTGV